MSKNIRKKNLWILVVEDGKAFVYKDQKRLTHYTTTYGHVVKVVGFEHTDGSAGVEVRQFPGCSLIVWFG